MKNKTKLGIFILIFSVVFIIFASCQGATASSVQTCPVTITVLDSKTHNPIQSARVEWNGRTRYTNHQGIVSFDITIHSSHNVYVSKPGYHSSSVQITCQSCGNPTSRTVYLQKKIEQCKLKMDTSEITTSKSEICIDKSDTVVLTNYLDAVKKPPSCQGDPSSSVRVKVFGRCEHFYDWVQIKTFYGNAYEDGSYSFSKSLTTNDFKKITGWENCGYFRIKTISEFTDVSKCEGYDCQEVSNIIKVYPNQCKEVCGVKVKSLQVLNQVDENIITKIKNTGTKGSNIDVKFYVDSSHISTKHVYLNPGQSTQLSKYYPFSCGTHQVKVKAIADCNAVDSKIVTYNKPCLQKGDLKVRVERCSDGAKLGNSWVSVSGPESRDGYTNNNGEIYFNNLFSEDYTVTADKSGYYSNSKSVWVRANKLTTKTICLHKKEEQEAIVIEDVDIEPSEICRDEDRDVEVSADVSLDKGNDDTKITARFYIKENGDWEYIGKESRYMNVGETEEFDITYYYMSGELDEGSHKVKVKVENGDSDTEYSYLEIEECEKCSFEIVDTSFPSSVRKGGIFNIFAKLRMKYNFEDPKADVYIYFKPRESTKTKTYHFDYDGDTDKKTFSFNTDSWNSGKYDIYLSALEQEGRCDFDKKIGSIRVIGERCTASIKKFYSTRKLYIGEEALFVPVVKNTGSSREKIETFLYIDGELENKWTDFLDPGEESSMNYRAKLDKGSHEILLKVVPCGDYSRRVTIRRDLSVKEIEDEEEDEIREILTEVDIAPDELVTGLCKGTVTAIDIKSSTLQEFNIKIQGINEKWIDYSEKVKVDGKKRLYVYINPKALGDYTFTIKVSGEEESFKEKIDLHVVPAEEVEEREWPSVSGAITSLKTSTWGLILLIVVFLIIVYFAKRSVLSYEEEVYSPEFYNRTQSGHYR